MAKIVRRKSDDSLQISDAKSQPIDSPLSVDLDEMSRLIRQRRSIFPPQYSDEIIPREKIELLLENAHWAPNHGRTEPWLFKVFEGKALGRLGQVHADLYQQHTPTESFKPEKYEKLKRRPTECSHVIAICMKRGHKAKIPVIEEVEAVACAVQNLWLTATALGIAGYWSSGGMTYHEGMKEFMELGEEDQFLGFFLLGMPKDEAWPRGKRESDWQEKVQWIEE
ncbi:MAG: nitroreductase [Bacteroidota bacterium]